MKLTQVALTNFLAHEESQIDLSRPLTVVNGLNGSGKSSVADAVKYALIGRCRSTDRAGRGADKLIRTGETVTVMGVELRFDTPAGSHHLIRTSSKTNGGAVALTTPDGMTHTGKAADARLGMILGADSDLVDATLDMPSWFDLKPDRQSEILSGVLRLKLTIDDVLEEARSSGLSDPAVESLSGGLQRLTVGRETFGPEILDALYDRVFEMRKEEKKALASLEAQKSVTPSAKIPTAEELQAARDLVHQLDMTLSDTREAIGRHKGALQEQSRTTAEITGLKERLAEAQKAQPKLALQQGPALEELTAQLKDLERSRTVLIDRSHETCTVRDGQTMKIRAMDQEIAAIEAGDTACPSIHAPAVCPLSEANLAPKREALKKTKQAALAAKKELVQLQAVAKEAIEAESACSTEIYAIKVRIAAAREAAAKQDGAAEQIEERLAILEANLGDLEDPGAELRAAESRVFGIDRDLSEARQTLQVLDSAEGLAKARDSISAAYAEKADEVAVLEELCKALDPKALPARILGSRIGPVVTTINERLSQITDGAYHVAIRAEKGLVLDVYKGGERDPLPIENLSSSERLRIGIALAATLSLISGLKILVIDNADILDAGNRDLLSGSLFDLGMESVVVISTREEPSGASSEDVGVYWIAGGIACEVVTTEDAVRGEVTA